MAKIYTVNVTAKNIKDGQNNIKCGKKASASCAIALALRRLFKTDVTEWGYESGEIGNKIFLSLTPSKTSNFVISHDGLNGEKVRPFKFRIQEMA